MMFRAQDARDVRTKNSKTFTSTFFPVGEDIEAIVAEWIGELKSRRFEPDDPLFPATKMAPDANRHFAAVGRQCSECQTSPCDGFTPP